MVNISFGNDNTPRGPLKAGVTNLRYANGCPNDGEYGITNLSFGCFNNTWHLLAGDHTGDVGGRFMVINASFEPSDFFVDTVTGLCGNTVYELAAWAANVLRPTSCGGVGIRPNLTFKIETITGVVLQQFNSGDIAPTSEKTWRQFGTFFTTPSGAGTVVLRITNNSRGGCGNDLMLDDITFRPCGPQVSAYIATDPAPYLDVCENDQKNLVFTASYSGGFIDPVLQWQVSRDTGKNWIDIAGEQGLTYTRTATAAGRYQYRVAIAERANFSSLKCRIASNVTTITVNPGPRGPTYTNILGCTGNSVRLDAVQLSDYTYQWSGPNNFSSALPYVLLPDVKYTDSGLYKVELGILGCRKTDSFYLRVAEGTKAVVSGGASICEGAGTTLTASGGVTYLWTPATGLSDRQRASTFASPADTTEYQVLVTNQYGCKDSARVQINVWKKPFVNAGVDQRIFEGESVQLQGMVGGTSVDFSWSPSATMLNAASLSPTVTPTDNTTYTLTASSELGCGSASDEVTIRVFKKLRPPNAFTPNGDGTNDEWIIGGLDTYPDAIVKVYSRSGLVVFHARSGEKNWDGTYGGKAVPVGTYYYLIILGTNQPPLSGWIVILR